MSLIKGLLRKTKKIDFLFQNDFNQLMRDEYTAKYNDLSEDKVYSNQVISNLVKMKPRNLEVLDKVFDLPKENIELLVII